MTTKEYRVPLGIWVEAYVEYNKQFQHICWFSLSVGLSDLWMHVCGIGEHLDIL